MLALIIVVCIIAITTPGTNANGTFQGAWVPEFGNTTSAFRQRQASIGRVVSVEDLARCRPGVGDRANV